MTPSQEAIQLAVKLSGHTGCECAMGYAHAERVNPSEVVCSGCLGDAATIDKELALPQRTAALLLAQQVCDADTYEGDIGSAFANFKDLVYQLRDALAAIPKTK